MGKNIWVVGGFLLGMMIVGFVLGLRRFFPKLIPDWATVLRYAWSIRLTVVSIFFGALEAILPHIQGVIPGGVFLALSIIAALGSFFARIVDQRNLGGTA